MINYLIDQVQNSIQVKQALLVNPDLIEQVKAVCRKTVDAYNMGNKTIFAGNGGSAADAQHLAGEMVSKFYFDRPGLASIALTTDTSVLTAIGNDYGYEKIFARQLQANGNKGDVFFGISTSGNSVNVIQALNVCKEKEITSIGLTGASGGKMAQLCDICIKVPSNETPRVQEVHILIGHMICAVVEETLFGKGFDER